MISRYCNLFLHIPPPFELSRAETSWRGMPPPAEVFGLDVFEDRRLEHSAGCDMVFLSSNSVCSVAKKPSNDRVIQRVADRAHRTKYASLLEPTGKGKRGVLTTMVRVVNQPILWTTVVMWPCLPHPQPDQPLDALPCSSPQPFGRRHRSQWRSRASLRRWHAVLCRRPIADFNAVTVKSRFTRSG